MIGRQPAVGQQCLEAELAHALDQNVAVLRIARTAPGNATLRRVQPQGFHKGGDRMGWRGEAPLTGFFHGLPLGKHIEAEANGCGPLAACSSLRRAITKPKPGTPSMHLLAEDTMASKQTDPISSGSAPKALMESIRSLRPARSTASDISATGLRMPELVSQWTSRTWVMSGSASRMAATSGAARRQVVALVDHHKARGPDSQASGPRACRRRHWRAPGPCRPSHEGAEHGLDREGCRLPCIGTHSYSPAVSPASSSSRRRNSAVMARKSSSQDPQSRSIACFTEAAVVRGPGVSKIGLAHGGRREVLGGWR